MTERFIEWLNKQIGSIYVWGAQGEFSFNEEWIRKMENSEKNAERAIALFRQRKKEGKSDVCAYDCSGLVVRFFIDNGIIRDDMTAQGLYSCCDKIERELLTPGDLVFRWSGSKIHHVGVYVGGDMVIHSKGRDVGVVKEHIDVNGESYWNRFGRMAALFADEGNYPRLMRYCGETYVNLRAEARAAADVPVRDKIAHDEIVIVLGIGQNGWADVVKIIEGRHCVRGYCVAKYFGAV